MKPAALVRSACKAEVAPFTGAWIETLPWRLSIKSGMSHPSRVRGLKQMRETHLIETVLSHPSRVRGLKLLIQRLDMIILVSHPSRVRGLKHQDDSAATNVFKSHPSRVRGLKLLHLLLVTEHLHVAPFTGAWIETNQRLWCIV